MKENSGNPRTAYHRRIQQRQTVIFGSIAAIMAVLFVLCSLIWIGLIPLPIKKNFSERESYTAGSPPCIEDGTGSVPLSDISITVYNSTKKQGLAQEVATKFEAMGVNITNMANWGGASIKEPALIQAGPDGLAAAYTLAQYIPGSVIRLEKDGTGANISVVLGAGYHHVLTSEDIAQKNPDHLLYSAEGCVALNLQEHTAPSSDVENTEGENHPAEQQPAEQPAN